MEIDSGELNRHVADYWDDNTTGSKWEELTDIFLEIIEDKLAGVALCSDEQAIDEIGQSEEDNGKFTVKSANYKKREEVKDDINSHYL